MSQEIVNEVEGEEVETTEVVETEAQDTDGAGEQEGADPYAELSHEDAIERLKKAEALIVKNKKEGKKETKETPEPTQPVTNISEAERLERIELRQDGYPDEIVDEIIKLGGRTALANPIVKESADRLLKQHKAKVAGEVKSDTSSTSVTKYTLEELRNMSADELEKVLPKKEE